MSSTSVAAPILVLSALPTVEEEEEDDFRENGEERLHEEEEECVEAEWDPEALPGSGEKRSTIKLSLRGRTAAASLRISQSSLSFAEMIVSRRASTPSSSRSRSGFATHENGERGSPVRRSNGSPLAAWASAEARGEAEEDVEEENDDVVEVLVVAVETGEGVERLARLLRPRPC